MFEQLGFGKIVLLTFLLGVLIISLGTLFIANRRQESSD